MNSVIDPAGPTDYSNPWQGELAHTGHLQDANHYVLILTAIYLYYSIFMPFYKHKNRIKTLKY